MAEDAGWYLGLLWLAPPSLLCSVRTVIFLFHNCSSTSKEMAAVVKEYSYILAVQPEPSTAADSSISHPILWKPMLAFLVACKNKHLSSAAVGRLWLPALPFVCCLVWQRLSLWKEEDVSGIEKCPQVIGFDRLFIDGSMWNTFLLFFFFSLTRNQETLCRINIERKNEMKMDSEQKRGMQVLHVADSHRGMVLPCWRVHPHYSSACVASGVLSFRTAGGWCHWSQKLVLSPVLWVLGYSSVGLEGRDVILCTVCISMLHSQHCCFSLSSYLHVFV